MTLPIKAVKFTITSKLQLQDTIDYIINEFGFISAEKFVTDFNSKLDEIAAGKINPPGIFLSQNKFTIPFSKKNYFLTKNLLLI